MAGRERAALESLTELAVVLGRVHAQDVRDDRVDVDGADERGEEQLLHERRLERAQRGEAQEQLREAVLGLVAPRLADVLAQLLHRLVLEALHLSAGRRRVICGPDEARGTCSFQSEQLPYLD